MKLTTRFTRFMISLALVIGLLTAVPLAFAQEDTVPNPTQIFTEIYNQVSPSVVSIDVIARSQGTDLLGQDQQVFGTGSGFVIDTEGHIVTNNHVVDGATEIVVNFVDGTLARAEIVGLDPNSDLAVLRVDLPAEELQPIPFGDSSALQIGETVLAIGSPFGERWTLTSGIVSAIERTIRGLTNFSIGGVIQTDAAINPGNSGGPLLNLRGEVVGVNSQIISGTQSSAGIGFAVPSNLAQRVAQQLIDVGYVEYSYLGIQGGNVTLPVIEACDLPNDFQGVVISEATAGGPAARSELQSMGTTTNDSGVPEEFDIITAIDGTELRGIDSLITYLASETAPGDTVSLSVLRNCTEQIEVDVRLMPRPVLN
ncbi:MAG: trypsin-like peptidase domain-containing protein [Anaerolineae bacterium]